MSKYASSDGLKLPWSVAPLDGKYYGTIVLNCDGEIVLYYDNKDCADAPDPSERELEGRTLGEWLQEKCDAHWESATVLDHVEHFVETMNLRDEE